MTRPLSNLLNAAALTVALLTAGGCASAPASSLEASTERTVRHLTSQCYWHHEGLRALYGGMPVHVGCRRWAERQVKVSMPGA